MDPATCAWWKRWYHRRLRRADRQFMQLCFPYNTAHEKAEIFQFLNDCPGQDHWWCACGAAERRQLEAGFARGDNTGG